MREAMTPEESQDHVLPKIYSYFFILKMSAISLKMINHVNIINNDLNVPV